MNENKKERMLAMFDELNYVDRLFLLALAEEVLRNQEDDHD